MVVCAILALWDMELKKQVQVHLMKSGTAYDIGERYPNYLREYFWKEYTFRTEGYLACSVQWVLYFRRKIYMEYCKLQIGCMLVVLYIVFIYYKERSQFRIERRFSLFDFFLCTVLFTLLLDGVTAYTVNHLDTVNHTLNLVLHTLFFLGIDTLILTMFFYMLHATRGYRYSKETYLAAYILFVLNVIVVIWNIPSLEFRHGRISNYSMGISAYACYGMIGIYILLTIGLIFRRWNNIQSRKRTSILTCLLVIMAGSVYQSIFPDTLISSIGPTMMLLGLYVNVEDPAMKELTRYHEEMVMGFATLVESRDNSTGGHVKRTTRYVELLTCELRKRGYYKNVLTRDYVKNLLLAAPMHDIGKIAVPDAILQKPGKLTTEEFEIMRTHAWKGGEIIQETFSRMGNEQYLDMAYEIALYHHEKWNGKGYPFGLKCEDIPLCARIMAVADVFDAVSADRCYRAAMPLEKCFEIIAEGSGQDFDPLLAEVFLDIKDEVCAVREAASQ